MLVQEEIMLDILIVLLFVTISLIGITVYSKPDYNKDNFSFDNCNSIKAICAIVVVVFCHLSNYVDDSFLIKILDGLGTFAVTIFLMFSGFGVMKNYMIHLEYSSQLLKKRILRIVKPYIIVLVIYVFYYLANGYSINELINIDLSAIYSGDTIVSNSWFIFILIYLYVILFVCAKLLKKPKLVLSALFLISVISAVLMKLLHFCPCWYISLLSFSFGCIYAYYQDKYNKIIKQRYSLFFISNVLLLICLLYLNFTAFPNNSNIIFDQIKYLAFLNMLVLVTIKFSFGNILLGVIFDVSYELYLIHGLVIILLSNFLSSNIVLCALSLSLSIVIAYVLKKAQNNIIRY